MAEQDTVYRNAQSIRKLGEAFASMTSEPVAIPFRDCQDVPEFIRQLQSAQEATRNHCIKFG